MANIDVHPGDKEVWTDKLWRAANEVDFEVQVFLEKWLLTSQIIVAIFLLVCCSFGWP